MNSFPGEHTMFLNNLVFSFLPSSSLSTQRLKVPFTCRFKPGTGLLPEVVLDDEEDEDDYEYEDDDEYDDDYYKEEEDLSLFAGLYGSSAADQEMYKMIVEVPSRPLVSERSESADVAVGDVLTVQTNFETR